MKCIIYKANITTDTEIKEYIGATEPTFKTRFGNHKHSFNNVGLRQSTSLSKYVWTAKERGDNFNIKWDMQQKAFPYKCGTRKCDLCLNEKLLILKSDPEITLNKKSEILNKCRHALKYKLCKVK